MERVSTHDWFLPAAGHGSGRLELSSWGSSQLKRNFLSPEQRRDLLREYRRKSSPVTRAPRLTP